MEESGEAIAIAIAIAIKHHATDVKTTYCMDLTLSREGEFMRGGGRRGKEGERGRERKKERKLRAMLVTWRMDNG